MEKWQRRGRQITDLTCEDWDRVSQGLPKHDERHEYVKMAKDMTRGFAKAKKSGALPK